MSDPPPLGPAGGRETRRHFRQRVDAALADPHLQAALRQGLVGLREKRARAFQSLDFETGRQELKRRRSANQVRLPELLEEFRARFTEVGGVFHWAPDAQAARRIVGEICQRAGAGVVTKSKSMATEEIQLNPYLESLGMEVVETDLGERMVQLTKSHPSHLIAPAIHLTKEQWAKTFHVEPDINAIQAEARRSLRDLFIKARVGITGANAAIAETGTLMLVTNEGNADLTTTLPPVHVAIFGIDKLVADLDDAVAILRMLGRSGTGQRMTSYVNWITGPSRSADIEQSLAIGVHGPGEVHCVVIDNGRSQMAADPLFKEALNCIRCGACSNACPPFMAVSGHQFGHIYNGPIGLVLTPFHHGADAICHPQSLCLQCNACQEACPVDIPLPRQILEHRRRAPRQASKRVLLRLWESGLAQPALSVAAPLSGLLPHLPAPLARPPFRARVRPGGQGEPVTIFASCLVDRMTPGAGEALAKILRAGGAKVEFPKSQWCCGLIAANAGDFEAGARLAARLALSLGQSEGPIVTPSASCFGAMTQDAVEWGADPDLLGRLKARMRDSTRFLLELLEARPALVRPPDAKPPLIAYHDSCQTLRQLGLKSEPRRVLELAGYEVVEIPDIANCCGFGGTFSADWPQVADRILEWKLEAIGKTGAATVASDNPGCLAHMAEGARRRSLGLRFAHVLELVAERLA